MSAKFQIRIAIEAAISDGRKILAEMSAANGKQHGVVDPEAVSKWLSDCRNVLRLTGDKGVSYADPFKDSSLFLTVFRCKSMLGALESLLGALDHGLLDNIESLFYKDEFTSLLQQADELLNQGHCLAAGVICRAVFEEHLRSIYRVHHSTVSERPAIEVMVRSLAGSKIFTKIAVMNSETILSQGNHCAHNKQPPLKESDLRGLIQKVRTFLLQHPLH